MNGKLHSCGKLGSVFWSPRFGYSAVLQSDGRIPHILSSDATLWDATNRSLCHETSQSLRKLNVHCRIHKSPSLDSTAR
jgi:hypothetical protein